MQRQHSHADRLSLLRNVQTAWQLLTEHVLTPMLLLDIDATIILTNPAVQTLLGSHNTGSSLFGLLNDTDARTAQRCLDALVSSGAEQRFIARYSSKQTGLGFYTHVLSPIKHDQQIIAIMAQLSNLHDQPLGAGSIAFTGNLAIATDNGDAQNTLARMQTLSSALEQTADLVMITDRDGKIEYVNPAFEQVTGYNRDEIAHKTPRFLNSGKQDRSFYKNLWETILGGDPFTEVFINKRKDGSVFYEEKTITPIRDSQGAIAHFVATGKDISERMRTQERMQFLTHHDTLTKLPNRSLFMDRLRQAIARARWHHRMVAVIIVDLDRFHELNDRHGQHHCDHILLQLGKRLSHSVRSGDTVARFGSDEFAVLLEDMASEKDVLQLAKKLLDTLVAPFTVDNIDHALTASLGVSIFPTDGEDAETLLRNADVAVYRAKDLGRNNYQFYSNELSARVFERLTMENALRHALVRDELQLLYQPQFDIRTHTIIGVEALLRWRHPQMGLISPGDFIPILEETGLIAPVGEWVLRQACTQAQRWHQAGIKNLSMAVNVSGRQFNNPDFSTNITNIITSTGITPGLLELELTESMLMRNASKTVSALNTLHHIGVTIAVDDFGTGYSSLNYLRRFPISSLKIDRSFIRDIAEDSDDAAIATAIIVMGQSLNLKVIAEGVETQQQLDFLYQRGCYFIQGNLLASARSAEDIQALLINHHSTVSG
ncbi:MAG: EAL domain-containing protein [Gammaproteobacteria bacterium]|nr:EAL domain-containing protein [Gammaproteobacteria bacterium]